MARFLNRRVRVNHERVLGLTGAQHLAIVTIFAGAWIVVECTDAPRPGRQETQGAASRDHLRPSMTTWSGSPWASAAERGKQ